LLQGAIVQPSDPACAKSPPRDTPINTIQNIFANRFLLPNGRTIDFHHKTGGMVHRSIQAMAGSPLTLLRLEMSNPHKKADRNRQIGTDHPAAAGTG
jgi:hypothetical protein